MRLKGSYFRPCRIKRAARSDRPGKTPGFTLLEVLITLVIGALVMIGLSRVVGQALHIHDTSRERQELTRQARFAMARMTRAVRNTGRLLLPLDENPATGWSESVRDVLAVTLDPTIDWDRDGIADADNDGDGLVDEDLPGDNNNDGAPGIIGIDDNGDGAIDVSSAPTVPAEDDDEDSLENEDYLDSLDNDSDGSLGEDYPQDLNHDNQPGVAGVDDDGDDTVDEGHLSDDDEDGSNNEDWFDPVVFFLSGTTLMERHPVTWDENGDTKIDGLDFVENPLADNVSQFRVERLAKGGKKSTLVDITLTLDSGGDSFTLHTRTRAGDLF